ncbi:MAG: substrate binding domain-containing protein [Marinibacterium sp.]|nr:substrate binding domain-containing protein [Marinibacterium sp.]
MSSIFMDLAKQEVELDIQAMTHPHDVLSELRMQYDCIIHLGAPKVSSFPEMTQRTLGHFNYQLFAAKDYLARHPAPDHPEQLSDYQLLVQIGRDETEAWHLSDGVQSTELTPSPAFTSNDPWIVKLAAVHGRGICFLPTFFARQEVAAGALVPVLPDWSSAEVGVFALYWSHRYANPNLAMLLDLATSSFGQIDQYLYTASSP